MTDSKSRFSALLSSMLALVSCQRNMAAIAPNVTASQEKGKSNPVSQTTNLSFTGSRWPDLAQH